LNNFLIGAPGLSSGLYNPTGTYAYNKLPDFVFKAAADPGWGHFEVFGLVSEFRDRAYPCYYANGGFNNGATPNLSFPDIPATACLLTGSTSPTSGAFNNSRTGGGIGGNARVPLLSKKVEVGVHFFGGNGIGRYGTSACRTQRFVLTARSRCSGTIRPWARSNCTPRQRWMFI